MKRLFQFDFEMKTNNLLEIEKNNYQKVAVI